MSADYRAKAARGEPGRDTLRAWILASMLRACGLTVTGVGARLTVAHGLRTADIDVAGRSWTTEARRVAWRSVGTESDVETCVDVAMWLIEQVEPPWHVADDTAPFSGAVHPLDHKEKR